MNQSLKNLAPPFADSEVANMIEAVSLLRRFLVISLNYLPVIALENEISYDTFLS